MTMTASPYMILRTVLILFCGIGFVKLLEGHPVGILTLGLISLLAFGWLAYDLHMMAVSVARGGH